MVPPCFAHLSESRARRQSFNPHAVTISWNPRWPAHVCGIPLTHRGNSGKILQKDRKSPRRAFILTHATATCVVSPSAQDAL